MTAPQIAGLILAGGKASRFGGRDKAMIPLDGQPLLAHAILRLGPQVARLMLSANGAPERFQAFGLPVLKDPLGQHWGPLAGILAGLEHLAETWPDIGWLASVPTDSPFLPKDLVARLHRAVVEQGAELAMAASGGQLQPVFALWPVTIQTALRQALCQGLRKVDQFAQAYRLAIVTWPDAPFFNINDADQLREAGGRLHYAL